MKHVSNEQKAEQISQRHKNFYYLDDGTRTTSALECYYSAMEMAEWKDKERKELWRITRNHYQEWAEEQIAQEKQKMIEKAYEFISKKFFISVSDQAVSKENYCLLTELISDLTKAMKGE